MAQNTTSWPQKAAVVITDSKSMGLHLKQILLTYNWRVQLITANLRQATKTIEAQEASMIIIDDQLHRPAIIALRQLMRHPLGFATPIIVLMLEDHQRERSLMSRMSEIAIAEKPLSPTKFLPVFWKTIRKWETKPLIFLRFNLYRYLKDPATENLVKQWQGLVASAGTGTLATNALSLALLRKGDLTTAEKLLLQSIKAKNSNMGTVLILVDIYLNYAMPMMARKLLQFADRNQTGLGLVPDMIQTDLMLGEWDAAVKRLNLLIKQGFLETHCRYILSRLLNLAAGPGQQKPLASA